MVWWVLFQARSGFIIVIDATDNSLTLKAFTEFISFLVTLIGLGLSTTCSVRLTLSIQKECCIKSVSRKSAVLNHILASHYGSCL